MASVADPSMLLHQPELSIQGGNNTPDVCFDCEEGSASKLQPCATVTLSRGDKCTLCWLSMLAFVAALGLVKSFTSEPTIAKHVAPGSIISFDVGCIKEHLSAHTGDVDMLVDCEVSKLGYPTKSGQGLSKRMAEALLVKLLAMTPVPMRSSTAHTHVPVIGGEPAGGSVRRRRSADQGAKPEMPKLAQMKAEVKDLKEILEEKGGNDAKEKQLSALEEDIAILELQRDLKMELTRLRPQIEKTEAHLPNASTKDHENAKSEEKDLTQDGTIHKLMLGSMGAVAMFLFTFMDKLVTQKPIEKVLQNANSLGRRTGIPVMTADLGPVEQATSFSIDTSGEADQLSKLPIWVWRTVLLVMTMLWASNYACIKGSLDAMPTMLPSEYSALRFGIAGLALSPFLFQGSQAALLGGAEIGCWISFGYFAQAIGLLTTTANKSSFICALQVLFVAAVSGMMSKKLENKTLFAAMMMVVGVGMLELQGATEPVIGDLWSLAQPIGFGMGYIRLERLMKDHPDQAMPVAAAKMAITGLCGLLWVATQGHSDPSVLAEQIFANQSVMLTLLWTGLFTSALTIVLESFAFRYVEAKDASIILASEPLWAAVIAATVLHEQLGIPDMLGGALLVGGCMLNELPKAKLPSWLQGITHFGSSSDATVEEAAVPTPSHELTQAPTNVLRDGRSFSLPRQISSPRQSQLQVTMVTNEPEDFTVSR
jgi:drug/metabolite transporter (DMT)-like permease